MLSFRKSTILSPRLALGGARTMASAGVMPRQARAAPAPPVAPPLPPRNYKVNRKPRRAPASWANLPSQAVGVVDQLVDRSLRNQRAPVRYRTEGGGESARGTGIEAPLLQFSFCPLLSLLPLSSRLERPRCAEKEGAPKFLLLFRSRKSRKRAAQKLLPESRCGARLFTRRTPSLAHLTRLRPPRPPPLTPRPPLLLRRRSVSHAASSGVVGVMTVS